jgi:hypothetical protein
MTDDENARSSTSPDDGRWTVPILSLLFAMLAVAGLVFMLLAPQ